MRTPLLTLLAIAAFTGCTRSVPAEFPPGSGASLHAPSAPVARIGRTLQQEPPLPGERVLGWEALETGAPEGAGHHHHHHHGRPPEDASGSSATPSTNGEDDHAH